MCSRIDRGPMILTPGPNLTGDGSQDPDPPPRLEILIRVAVMLIGYASLLLQFYQEIQPLLAP